MKKILFFVLGVLIPTIVFSANRNLREGKGTTLVSASGVYTYSEGSHAGGGALSVTQLYKWVHFGATAGVNSQGCFNTNLFVGPKIGSNFYVAPSLVLGMRQVREYSEYINTHNLDLFTYSRPAPRLTVGAGLRIGYNFGKVGIFAGASYERAFAYSRSEMLAYPWEPSEKTSPKHIISAELGLAVVLSEDNMISGDNCLEISAASGYSSMGGYVSIDLEKFSRLGWCLGHTYGGFTNFYFQSGNAEIGGRYNLEFYPGGSNSIYNCGIGVEAAMGQYRRSWSGVAEENPDRLDTQWSVYSFGGRGSVVVTPVALQFGIVNISIFGNVGVVGQVPVTGLGDFGYQAESNAPQFYWSAGAKIAFAL
jgi:hypothetical protein